MMLLGVIADDFTGASDIANTIAKGLPGQGGLISSLYLGIPEADAPGHVEAGIVALKSRTIPVAEAVGQSLAALDWLLRQGCEQIVFKYCSTFDSTPEGNIGPVAEALAHRLGAKGVVVCPAFPEAGRTIYQGHLFVGHRLLSESGMRNHPLTPMTDPDIRRWLQQQCAEPVGLVRWQDVQAGWERISAAVERCVSEAARLVVVDALTVDDLVKIGAASRTARLITGGSGIASGLPANFISEGKAAGNLDGGFTGANGAGVILAGSCSGATRGQLDAHKAGHPALAIDVEGVMAEQVTATDVADFLIRNLHALPVVYSSGTPEEVARLQQTYGQQRVADRLDALFAEVACRLVSHGVRKIIVAGGETSGAVVSALNLGALQLGPEIDPGVPVVMSEGSDPLLLALKSGNFGAENFFEKAFERMSCK